MKHYIPESELIINDDGSIFHLHLRPEQLSDRVILRGNKINHLFCGTAAEAKNSRSRWLDPTVDTVTYDDGTEEKVSGFNIPVEKIGVEFPVALIGKKGIWYDHMVSVSDVQ